MARDLKKRKELIGKDNLINLWKLQRRRKSMKEELENARKRFPAKLYLYYTNGKCMYSGRSIIVELTNANVYDRTIYPIKTKMIVFTIWC